MVLATWGDLLKALPATLAALCAVLLGGCGTTAGGCNVILGPTQGIVVHGVNCEYPGLVTLPDGALLTAYTCPGSTIVTQISRDQGATWTPAGVIHFAGSAEALALLPGGRLILTTSLNAGGVPTYMMGTIGAGDGITWGAPTAVPTAAWTKGCWAVSPVVALADGTLLWPVWCYSNTTGGLPGTSTVLLSNDGGTTWPTQVTVAGPSTAGRDYDESAAAVFSNGDIVMILRQTTEDPYGSWWRSKSTDGGKTWTAPIQVTWNREVGRPALALLPGGGLVLMGRYEPSGPASTSFATSWDEGVMFSSFTGLGIGGGSSGDNYDAMSLLSDESIGVVSVHSNPGGKTNNVDYRNLIDQCSSSSAAAQ